MRTTTWLLAGALLAAGGGSVATADLINGGFETGDFKGWMTTGDASIQTSSFGAGPAAGTYQALITTGTSADGGSFSGTDAVSAATLATFLGTGAVGTQGSGIKQAFMVTGGSKVTFSWDFLTNEDRSDPMHKNDLAFYVLDGVRTDLTSVDSMKPGLMGSATPFIFETGYQSTTVTFGKGNHTLGFGVVDATNNLVNSGMLLDSVIVSVPEPSALALATLGAGLMLSYARWRSRRPACAATRNHP